MPESLSSFIDAATDAIAREVANLRREAQREKELRDAEHRALLAELRLSAADLHRQVETRLEMLKDGEPGAPGLKGDRGDKGDAGESIVGPPGLDGKRGEPGKDGRDGSNGAPGIAGKDGEPGRDGADGKDGSPGRDGERGDPGIKGAPGETVVGPPGSKGDPGESIVGPQGERGAEGSAGKLPIVCEWSDGVHYQSDVVMHAGATYQALRDTAKVPPHEDWICIARAGHDGNDGRSLTVRGTWLESEEYRALDVVALNGGSFMARRDNPGPCPGDGWQLIAAQGKQGKPGPQGHGERGRPGPAVASMSIDEQGQITLTNADGSIITCDLYPVLSRIA